MTGAPKLRITAAELNTPEVDAKLRDREVVTGARRHYDEADVPTAAPRRPRWAWLYWPPLCFALAGLLGGLAGWALGQPLHLRPDLRSEAADVVAAADDARARAADGRLTAAEAEAIVGELRRDAAANPYAVAELDPSLTPAERQSRLDAQASLDARAAFWADFLFYGVGGLCLAACLSCVEPLIERNWPRAAVVGATAAGVGLAGGVAAALLSASLLAAAVPQGLVPAACYALLGLFVGVPPGLVLRSSRRAAVGAAAGAIGGAVGGGAFDLLVNAAGPHVGRLVALLVVGGASGAALGLLEDAAKTGWLLVRAGLIAGKQFVLYRNPTYVGSSPLSHVYLFRDPQVGRRHAAIHAVPGGFEIENLPLGGPTLVNGLPVARARLRGGDEVRIGRTTFTFHCRAKPAAGTGQGR